MYTVACKNEITEIGPVVAYNLNIVLYYII